MSGLFSNFTQWIINGIENGDSVPRASGKGELALFKLFRSCWYKYGIRH